jgi:SAM-dependent methyltransferase
MTSDKANQQFDAYAAFYDLLYKDKDYRGEADYINLLVERFQKGKKSDISLLDLACGTAKHLIELASKGYGSLAGSDISGPMIDIARKRAEELKLPLTFFNHSFQQADKIDAKFDVVISMFSAVNYLTNYEDQSRMLKNVHGLLKNDGLFVFDYWNGCAVTKHYSPVKALRKKSDDAEILRISETSINAIEQSATVKFICNYFKGNQRFAEFEETHHLHYYYFSEMRNLLASHNFEILYTSPFMALDKNVSEDDWNISIIAKPTH